MRRLKLTAFALLAASIVTQSALAAPQCALEAFRDLQRWKNNEPTCAATDRDCRANPEEVAAVYNAYAIASVGAYYSDADKSKPAQAGARARTFQLDAFDATYTARPYIEEADSGLGLRVSYKRVGDTLTVVMAFRGTDSISNRADILSDLSWFTQWFRDADQYKRARRAVTKIRAEAEALPGVNRVAYLTTGHSLGGGLARHVANAFPCTAAIAFHSSPVTNEFTLFPSFPAQVILVHETGDWTGFIAQTGEWLANTWDRLLGRDKANAFRRYGLELIRDNSDQHSIERFAISMSRLQICCEQRQHWATLLKDDKAKRENRCSSLVKDVGGIDEAKRFYCEKYRRLKLGTAPFPVGDVCDVTSPRRGESCGLRKLIDQAKPSGG